MNTLQRLAFVLVLITSFNAWAVDPKDNETSFSLNYLTPSTWKFKGGADVEVKEDMGFHFRFASNFTEHLAGNFSFGFHSQSYESTRVLDTTPPRTEQYSNKLDKFTLGFGGDYYFLTGNFTPYVSARIAYNLMDTNIPAGSDVVCWWEWGHYVCRTVNFSYSKNHFSAGLGAGLRLDLSDRHFVKIGYAHDWLDLSGSEGTNSQGIALFEFGFKYRTTGDLF